VATDGHRNPRKAGGPQVNGIEHKHECSFPHPPSQKKIRATQSGWRKEKSRLIETPFWSFITDRRTGGTSNPADLINGINEYTLACVVLCVCVCVISQKPCTDWLYEWHSQRFFRSV